MTDIHITADLLEAVHRGDLQSRVVLDLSWNHLLHLCPTCCDGVRVFQERTRDHAADYDTALRVLPLVIERHAAEDAEKNDQAERDLRELLALSHAQRLTRIHRASKRFKGVLLAHRVLNESKRFMPEQPQKLQDLAEAAEQVILRTLQGPGYFDALARARAYQANALRARSKLREADERMASARSLIRHEKVIETLVYAEVDWLEGVLRKDQRRFQEAEKLLSRSAMLFELADEPIEVARPLVTLGLLYSERQEVARAIETTEAALSVLTPVNDPRLYLCARFNLAKFFVESGRFEAGGDLLQADASLYQQFANPWTVLRQIWLQGRIALAAGLFEEAEQRFLDARAGFIKEGIGYDAAMVSLDLALTYLRQNRTAAVKELAEEVHEIFTAAGLTAEMIEELTVYLKRARGNPDLRFGG